MGGGEGAMWRHKRGWTELEAVGGAGGGGGYGGGEREGGRERV